jgi:pimeloyl-ACP methyl ester carboxylesterase
MADKLACPVLAVGGDSCLAGLAADTMRAVADSVEELVVPQCGHFVPEERPDVLLAHLLPFLQSGDW